MGLTRPNDEVVDKYLKDKISRYKTKASNKEDVKRALLHKYDKRHWEIENGVLSNTNKREEYTKYLQKEMESATPKLLELWSDSKKRLSWIKVYDQNYL